MKRNEAYKVLHVSSPADIHSIEESYWRLAHEYRNKLGQQANARERLLELNEAYAALVPHDEQPPLRIVDASPHPDIWSTVWEALVSWVHGVVHSTAVRWPGRGAEVTALVLCLFALAGLAIGNGAGFMWPLVILTAALIVVRAPWRRVH